MSIEAMKLALEAMESAIKAGDWIVDGACDPDMALVALRQAIEQAEQAKPVACIIDGDLYFHHEIDWEDLAYQGNGVELLYTAPPQRKPIPHPPAPTYCTTEEERKSWVLGWLECEAAHGIKENT